MFKAQTEPNVIIDESMVGNSKCILVMPLSKAKALYPSSWADFKLEQSTEYPIRKVDTVSAKNKNTSKLKLSDFTKSIINDGWELSHSDSRRLVYTRKCETIETWKVKTARIVIYIKQPEDKRKKPVFDGCGVYGPKLNLWTGHCDPDAFIHYWATLKGAMRSALVKANQIQPTLLVAEDRLLKLVSLDTLKASDLAE